MEIIAFILLVGLWAAFVLPPVMNSRKEDAVEDTPQRTARTAAPAARPMRQTAAVRSQRDQVLARRRMALMGLAGLAVVTLIVAIVTGSWAILVLNLIADVALAGYIAVLLQIKQQQQAPGSSYVAAVDEYDDRKVRVVGG